MDGRPFNKYATRVWVVVVCVCGLWCVWWLLFRSCSICRVSLLWFPAAASASDGQRAEAFWANLVSTRRVNGGTHLERDFFGPAKECVLCLETSWGAGWVWMVVVGDGLVAGVGLVVGGR